MLCNFLYVKKWAEPAFTSAEVRHTSNSCSRGRFCAISYTLKSRLSPPSLPPQSAKHQSLAYAGGFMQFPIRNKVKPLLMRRAAALLYSCLPSESAPVLRFKAVSTGFLKQTQHTAVIPVPLPDSRLPQSSQAVLLCPFRPPRKKEAPATAAPAAHGRLARDT